MDALDTRSGWVAAEGATLQYRVEGVGIPTLVLGSSIYYPRTFSAALRAHLRLAFLDARHFAAVTSWRSDTAITLDTYLDDIDRQREAVGFERAVVLGHSHHGNLALEYAKRHPSRVSHVVMVGSPGTNVRRTVEAANLYWDSRASDVRKATLAARQAALLARWRRRLDPRDAYVAQHAAESPRFWYDPSYDAAQLWDGMPVSLALIAVFRQFFADIAYEVRWDVDRMRAPVLALAGRFDFFAPPTTWDDVRRRQQNLAFRLFDYSGHTPQLEEPELFDHTLTAWLRQTTSTTLPT